MVKAGFCFVRDSVCWVRSDALHHHGACWSFTAPFSQAPSAGFDREVPIQTRNRKGYHLRTKSQARRIMPSLPPQRSQICPRAHGGARKKVWMNSLHFEISSEWRIRASPCTPTNHTPCIGTKAPLLLEAGAIRAETEAGEEAGAEASNPGDGGARNEVVVVANQTWVFV